MPTSRKQDQRIRDKDKKVLEIGVLNFEWVMLLLSTFVIKVANPNGFGIKRLGIFISCGHLKGHFIIFKKFSAWYLNQGLSNVKTFSWF